MDTLKENRKDNHFDWLAAYGDFHGMICAAYVVEIKDWHGETFEIIDVSRD